MGVAGLGSLTTQPGNLAQPGMMSRNSSVRLDDVRDGLSQTLLIGERRASIESPDGGYLEIPSTWVAAVPGVFRNAGDPERERLEGPGSLVLGVVGEQAGTPRAFRPNSAPAGIGFSSHHPGGVHFARVDGSAGLISDRIDPEVYIRLGQRADAQTPSNP